MLSHTGFLPGAGSRSRFNVLWQLAVEHQDSSPLVIVAQYLNHRLNFLNLFALTASLVFTIVSQ